MESIKQKKKKKEKGKGKGNLTMLFLLLESSLGSLCECGTRAETVGMKCE